MLEAVNGIRDFIAHYNPRWLYVLVSGGKDSVAVWGLADKATSRYVAVFLHIAGQTHYDNIYTVRRVAEKLGVTGYEVVRVSETRRIRPVLGEVIESCSLPCLLHIVVFTHRGEDYWKAMERYGYPAPLGRFGKGTRWCCGVFKHRVFQRLPYNGSNKGTPWKYGVDGVKATDSPYRRKKYPSNIITWEKTRDTYFFPLRTMTDREVWSILGELGLERLVARQYEKWGRSPNCMFCPMIGRRELIEKTVQAMPPAMRRMLYEQLEKLQPRYKPTTYSYRSISKWLEALGKHIGEERGLPEDRAAPAVAPAEA